MIEDDVFDALGVDRSAFVAADELGVEEVVDLASELRALVPDPAMRARVAAVLGKAAVAATVGRPMCWIPHHNGKSANLREVFQPTAATGTNQAGLVWTCDGTPRHESDPIAQVP